MFPDMSANVWLFSQKLIIYNNVQDVENFRPVQIPTEQEVLATVQVADPEKLAIDNVDFSLRYLEVHTLPPALLKINDNCKYNNIMYKLIFIYPNEDYQYQRSIFEEIKKPLPGRKKR